MFGLTLLLGAAFNPLMLPPFVFAGRITDYANCAYDAEQKVEVRVKTTDGKLVAKTTTATGGRSTYSYLLEIPTASKAIGGYVTPGTQLVFEFADPDGVVYDRLVTAEDAKVGEPGGFRELNVALATDANGDGIPDEYVDWLGYLMWENGKDSYDPDADWDGDGASNRAEYVAGTNPFDPTDRLSVREMAEEKGYKDYLKLAFLANRGRSYTVETGTELSGGDWRKTAFVDGADGKEKSCLNTPMSQEAEYRAIYVLKEGLTRQFWKLKVE